MASSVPNAQSVANQINGIIASKTNVANGLLGLDANGDALATLIHRFGTAAEIDQIVLSAGQTAYTTDTRETRLGDGSTVGGIFVGGGSRIFGDAVNTVPIASTTVGIEDSIPVSPGGVYRIRGMYSFAGDTDNQSNFRIQLSRLSGFWGPITGGDSGATCIRVFSRATWNTGAVYDERTDRASGLTSTLVISPITLTSAASDVDFDITFASRTVTTVLLQAVRRTANIGSPSIVGRRAFYVERIA